MSQSEKPPLSDRIANTAFLSVIGLARLLPYDKRIPAVGWPMSLARWPDGAAASAKTWPWPAPT